MHVNILIGLPVTRQSLDHVQATSGFPGAFKREDPYRPDVEARPALRSAPAMTGCRAAGAPARGPAASARLLGSWAPPP
jgi:hypothetical protein